MDKEVAGGDNGRERISVRAILAMTGWSFRYWRKLRNAGLVHRADPAAFGPRPRYWRAEILWLNTPPGQRRGPNPVTGVTATPPEASDQR
jgi:hypothetical protein